MKGIRAIHLAAVVALAMVVGVSGRGPGTDPPASPPQDATRVGDDTCATCHADLSARHARATHGNLAAFEQQRLPGGCESCHGPGSRHAESGDPSAIRSFKDASGHDVNDACLTCHREDQTMLWGGSRHATSDVACTSCHLIHQSREAAPGLMKVDGMAGLHQTAPAPKGSLAKSEPELCFGCHQEKRAKFGSTSHHPVLEGYMTCSSCHQVHGTGQENALLRTAERTNDLCLTCHASKQGPFVFEHPPVEESCLTCHDPHGTVANDLLRQGEPFLCLQCHEMHFHNARLAPTTPYYLPSGGSENPNGASGFMRGFGTKCSSCHTKIHGSDLPSQGVTGRGKALIR